jgi:hypothetical protein
MGEDCFDRKISRAADRRRKEYGKDDDDAEGRVQAAISKALEDVSGDLEFLSCYEETISAKGRMISNLTEADLESQKPRLQSELLANNLMLGSSISQILDKYTERVRAHLRPFPRWMKDHLIGMETRILVRIQEVIERYLNRIRDYAKRIGVLNFSISMGAGPVSFTFTFGI